MIFSDPLNWFAFAWFLSSWMAYTLYVKRAAKTRPCLAALLYQYRVDWIKTLMRRDSVITDVAVQNNLSQMVNFLASATVFAIAGTITAIYSAQDLIQLLSDYSFVAHTNKTEVHFKLFVLVMIFIFAFFKFTWSMRQYSFACVMMGALPYKGDQPLSKSEESLAMTVAQVSDQAGHEFNYGLRAYYFALALLTWFINPVIFILACTLVIAILYMREFKSTTLGYLVQSRTFMPKNFMGSAALAPSSATPSQPASPNTLPQLVVPHR